jgi:hypothetical protein
VSVPGTHVEHEVDDWSEAIPDHPKRAGSKAFLRAKATAHKILAEAGTGSLAAAMAGPVSEHPQAHHAGSLWVHDGAGWLLYLNPAGLEWSAQWCAEPARVDTLRASAARLYARFPETLTQLERLGYIEAREILQTVITDAAGVARWTDSLFNSCVMLSAGLHTGVIRGGTQIAGWHHVPKPVWDAQLTKRDDFTLWVTDAQGHAAAVAPVAAPGSGDGRVLVVWAHPGSALHAEHQKAAAAGKAHILGAGHPLAVQAFARQQETAA